MDKFYPTRLMAVLLPLIFALPIGAQTLDLKNTAYTFRYGEAVDVNGNNPFSNFRNDMGGRQLEVELETRTSKSVSFFASVSHLLVTSRNRGRGFGSGGSALRASGASSTRNSQLYLNLGAQYNLQFEGANLSFGLGAGIGGSIYSVYYDNASIDRNEEAPYRPPAFNGVVRDRANTVLLARAFARVTYTRWFSRRFGLSVGAETSLATHLVGGDTSFGFPRYNNAASRDRFGLPSSLNVSPFGVRTDLNIEDLYVTVLSLGITSRF